MCGRNKFIIVDNYLYNMSSSKSPRKKKHTQFCREVHMTSPNNIILYITRHVLRNTYCDPKMIYVICLQIILLERGPQLKLYFVFLHKLHVSRSVISNFAGLNISDLKFAII